MRHVQRIVFEQKDVHQKSLGDFALNGVPAVSVQQTI